ncbi:hypothetical protein VKT23_016158 [Stygiomarasmius scandens]|uniref:ubiquitinyl hydrolase 1 n=1 Tax=Marasmiellus scandens TaxID=2682957 RepID=A0ABR1J0F2_9AGAR
MSELQYIVNHVFMPPKLPEKDDYTIENEHALCKSILDSANRYYEEMVDKDGYGSVNEQRWKALLDMLKYIEISQKFEIVSINSVEEALRTMTEGSVRALLIRAQNAGVVIRKYSDEVVIESFEVTPPRQVVMQAQQKLIRSFPGPAIALAIQHFDNPYFCHEFASFLAQMNSNILDSVTTTKAGSTVGQKDSVDPRYITSLLTGILRGIGKPVDVPRIRKRMADDVLIDKRRGRPWRRSMVWLVLRVAMQTHFKDSSEYKIFMAYFMLDILKQVHDADYDSELLYCMQVKTTGRIHKLQDPAPESLVQKAHDIADRVRVLLSNRWKEVQIAQTQSSPWDPSFLREHAEHDTNLSLEKCGPYIKRILGLASTRVPSTRSNFTPDEAARPLHDLQDFGVYAKGRDLGNDLGRETSIALADLELSVQRNLEGWVNKAVGRKDINSVTALFNIFNGYLSKAKYHYRESPEDLSIMILTLFELWVALDRVVVAIHPLLAEYSPEIPQELFHPLLLRKESSIQQLIRLLDYLRRRHDNATYGTVYTDGSSSTSFAVRFFQQSSNLQKLKEEIEAEASRERTSKREEYKRLRSEYFEKLDKAEHLEHSYHEDSWGISRHSQWCSKCGLEESARQLQIDVHEWPLPDNTVMAMAVLFESRCPDAFNMWREATYTFLKVKAEARCDKLMEHNVGEQNVFVKLYSYGGMLKWVGLDGSRARRITLASEKASFIHAQYRSINISEAVSEDNVMVNNGLMYKLYDQTSQLWAEKRSEKLSISPMCTFKLTSSVYKSLQFSVDSPYHTSNYVISIQQRCHDRLSLHEFISFGNLRSGQKIQWVNILRELSTRILTFHQEDVHLLLIQTIWQIGQVSETQELEWHQDLSSSQFCHALIDELERLLKDIESNWMELTTARSIIALCCRLLETPEVPEVNQRLYAVLRDARRMAFGWMNRILFEEQPNDTKADQILERQRTICEMAFTCRGTYDVDSSHLQHLMATWEDISVFLQCAIRIFDNSPISWTDLPINLRRMHHRDRRLAHFVEPFLSTCINNDRKGVDAAVKAVWPDYSPGSSWNFSTFPNNRWIISSTSVVAEEDSQSQVVHVNIMEGRMLIDGKPLSQLPLSISGHTIFKRVFGSRALDVVPSKLKGFDFATRSRIYGYGVHFTIRNRNELVIQAHNDTHRLQLLSHQELVGDFPELMIQECVHWLDLETCEVEFRPLQSLWMFEPEKNWKLVFASGGLSTMSCGADLKLVDIRSNSFRMIAEQLQSLEHTRYLTITYSTHLLRLEVDLPRFRLSFNVNRRGRLECSNFAGMFVHNDQSIGTLFGLKNMIVLAPSCPSQPRKVLIPRGNVKFTTHVHHVNIVIDSFFSRDVRFFEYNIREDIGCLEGDGSLASHFYKAYLHALTSHCIPDPLTGRTGTEEALLTLQSARSFSFQNVHKEDIEALHNIKSLVPEFSFYPVGMEVMQTISWNSLPILSQHPAFQFTVQEVLRYCDSFSKLHGNFESDVLRQIRTVLQQTSPKRLIERKYWHTFPYYANVQLISPIHAADNLYCSRDLEMKDENRVYNITTSIWRGESFSMLNVINVLNRWSGISGPKTVVSLSYSYSWLSKSILSDHWLALYDRCRDGHIPRDQRRYQLVFSLSSLAFANSSSVDNIDDPIPVLVQFLENQQFRDIAPPDHPLYTLSDGITPTKERVKSFVSSSAVPFEKSPSYRLERKYREEEYSYDQRRQEDYRREINLGTEAIVNHLWAQWRTEVPCKPTSISQINLFDSQDFLSKTTNYFQSCIRNGDLTAHIQVVQAILNESTIVAPPKSSYIIDTSYHRPINPRRSFPTLEKLLSRAAPAMNTAISPDLHRLTTHLASSGDIVSQLFGDQLSQSTQALMLKRLVSYQNPSIYDQGKSFEVYETHCHGSERKLFDTIADAFCPKSNQEYLLAKAGLWPKITTDSLLRLLSYSQRNSVRQEWSGVLKDYGKMIVEYQRSLRLRYLYTLNDLDAVHKEMANNQPIGLDDPDWLLIQISSNFLARDIQVQVANEMISPSNSSNSVLQLNMGEGKSSVIVPMIAASLSNGERLVRVVVLRALSNQMFQLLVDRLCGLANRRIFYMPFSRDLKVNAELVSRIRSLYEQCMKEGGVLVVQPEHILSFRLMGIDFFLKDDAKGLQSVERQLVDCHRWLSHHSRDILDESDEILHTRYQLIYTMGKQRSLENHPNRWIMIQNIFALMLRHAKDLRGTYPLGIRFWEKGCSGQDFPLIHITQFDAERVLFDRIVTSILQEGSLSSYAFERLPEEEKRQAKDFICRKEVGESNVAPLMRYTRNTDIWKALLLLRGLFAHGILAYILKHRRWRVDYGLDQRRTLLAVPYRAKDVPSLRAEFGHPDVAICLTCLSYYYGGLDLVQLDSCFEILMKSDNPTAEYAEWARGVPEVPQDVNGVNLKDSVQRLKLTRGLSRNRTVINFYLSQVVFPKYAKEFPEKLTTSGWDIAEIKKNVTTGFSGTKDSQWLLPSTISQYDPVGQEGTNAKVISYLLQPENRHYECAKGPNNENLMAKDFLEFLVRQPLEIRVLLDVGAQILDLANEDVAKKWLDLKQDASAAVFFDEKDCLMVIDRQGNVEPLISSQYKAQLGKCLIYLDDAHTRGTDLKLPREYRAAVILGPKVTKDRLLQGCMRMRKLGNGQSVVFVAFDIDQKIRTITGKLDENIQLSSWDVLVWTYGETTADIKHHIPHWLKQGVDYIERKKAWDEFEASDRSSIDRLRTAWLQPEARTLEEMYGIGGHQASRLDFGTEEYRELQRRCQELGWDLGKSTLGGTTVDEEQEREVANEVKVERQVERPLEKPAADHYIHPDVRRFIATGVVPKSSQGFIPLFNHMILMPNNSNYTNPWYPGLLSTVDFAVTVKDMADRVDDYMRPVTWIVSGGSLGDSFKMPALVVVSPYEANELRQAISSNNAGLRLHIYAPQVTQSQRPLDDLLLYTIPPLSHSESIYWTPSVNQLVISQLNIFSGQLYLRDWKTYKQLCMFLGLYVPGGEVVNYQSDGFVERENRRGNMRTQCPFENSPLPQLQRLFGARRKGNGFNLTHIGRVVQGRVLNSLDFS